MSIKTFQELGEDYDGHGFMYTAWLLKGLGRMDDERQKNLLAGFKRCLARFAPSVAAELEAVDDPVDFFEDKLLLHCEQDLKAGNSLTQIESLSQICKMEWDLLDLPAN